MISEKELDEVMFRMKVVAGKRGPSSKFDEASIRAAFKKSMTKKGVSLSFIHATIRNDRKNKSNNESQQQKYTSFSIAHNNAPGTEDEPILVESFE